MPCFTGLDKAHNRGEEGKLYLATAIDLVDEAQEWKDSNSVLLVERKRIVGNKTQTSTQYDISSLTVPNPIDYQQ